jgi:hypothetical protein
MTAFFIALASSPSEPESRFIVISSKNHELGI